jgi:hypothetical protein
MSIEVEPKVNGEVSTADAVASVSVAKVVAGRPPLWRRRRIQVAALVAVVILIAGAVGTNLLIRQYSPDGAARDYLSALQSGNADAAWGVMQVNSAPKQTSASLSDRAALQAALRTKADLKSFATTGVVEVDSNRSIVSFAYDTSAGSKQGQFVVERSGENRFGLIPDWRVVVVPTILQLDLPTGTAGVSIDGHDVALNEGTSSVAVLPVAHRVDFKATAMLAAQTVSVDAFMSAGQTVAYRPQLTSAGTARVASAVKAFFATCAAKTDLRPDGCPQTYDNAFADSVQWQLVGDPTQAMSIGFDDKLQPTASSRYQMIVAYREPGVTGTSHDIAAGGYSAVLVLGQTDLVVASISASNSAPALQRPSSVTDQAVKTVVSKAFGACAQSKATAQADCPQQLVRAIADNVRWTLNGDPLASATVTFDTQTGVFKVHGDFSMTASFQINGYSTSGDSATITYDAYVLWDGQSLQLVTIGGAYS